MRGTCLLGLVIMTAAISVGCGGGSGTHQDVPAGQLVVSPSSLDFGKVAVGDKATKTGTLKAGNSRVTVTSADWSGEGYSVSGIAFPLTVAAGQSVSFTVTFAPQKGGSSSGNISFLSDASNSPNREAFSASGIQAAAPTGPFTKINPDPRPNPTFTDASVQGGGTYFYVTTALNKLGKESKFSNQVQVTIPNS